MYAVKNGNGNQALRFMGLVSQEPTCSAAVYTLGFGRRPSRYTEGTQPWILEQIIGDSAGPDSGND